MSTRTFNLTPDDDAFFDEVLGNGEYRDASEAIRDAIRALRDRRAMDALKLGTLRRSIEEGGAALEHGDYHDVDDVDLDAYLDGLVAPPSR
jgi:antitoxin ParD1/3/4